jgi:hypothetical protein
MRLVIPCVDELSDLRIEGIFGFNIDASHALPLEDREPLCDLIPPRTMHGREVHNNARRVGYPLLNFLPMRRTDMVAHEMDGTDALINLQIQRFQKGNAFPLPLPVITVPVDRARARVI